MVTSPVASGVTGVPPGPGALRGAQGSRAGEEGEGEGWDGAWG
jgi:hypothetical protein